VGEWLDRHGRSTWSIHNNVLNAWAMTIVLFGGLTAVFELRVLPFLVIQMVVGFPLLEVVKLPRALRSSAPEAAGRAV
jgi:alkane 1-monooxygenase